jgi:hypothetical protein
MIPANEISLLKRDFDEARKSGNREWVIKTSSKLAEALAEAGRENEAKRVRLIGNIAAAQQVELQPVTRNAEKPAAGQMLKVWIPEFPLTGILQFIADRTGVLTISLSANFPDGFTTGRMYIEEGYLIHCKLWGPQGQIVKGSLFDSLCEILKADIQERDGVVSFRLLDEAEVKSIEDRIPKTQAHLLTAMIFEGFTALDESGKDEPGGRIPF